MSTREVSKEGLGGKPGAWYQVCQSRDVREDVAAGSVVKKSRRQVLNSEESRDLFLKKEKYWVCCC